VDFHDQEVRSPGSLELMVKFEAPTALWLKATAEAPPSAAVGVAHVGFVA
jgi:hypothetical protein